MVQQQVVMVLKWQQAFHNVKPVSLPETDRATGARRIPEDCGERAVSRTSTHEHNQTRTRLRMHSCTFTHTLIGQFSSFHNFCFFSRMSSSFFV